MRKILLFLLLLLLIVKVQSQDYKDIIKIEFNTLNRAGTYEEITFTKDSIIFKSVNRQPKEIISVKGKKIRKAEYKKLVNSLKNIKLKNIPELKSPTMKRAFDGADSSEIVITIKNQIRYIHRFDNEDPHECLVPLMNIIIIHLKKMQG